MQVFMTGATGFIGGRIATKLRMRGDEVVCLIRDPDKGEDLLAEGCELLKGDLSDVGAIEKGVAGADAVIHAAAIYEVGIPKSARERMHDTNVAGTERVLRAALDAGTPKVVYVSTIAAFGNTSGEIVDESYEHRGDYTSYYEQTKHEAHQVAKRLISKEHLPCVIVQPGAVYGPGDHSQLGHAMDQFLAGRLPMIAFPEAGFNMVYVDDAADGVLLALDRGRPGESYVLGGQITTMREVMQTLAEVAGRKPPSRALPTSLLKASAPLGPIVGPLLGYPPNLRELISASDGVTYWARHDKAIAELGYAPRDLRSGLHDLLDVQGKLPAAA